MNTRASYSASGRRWFVRTPNRAFPIEPHALLPFVHWLPRRAGRALWRLGVSGDPYDEVRLLGARELRRLFPDAVIVRERAGPLTKSLLAVGPRERIRSSPDVEVLRSRVQPAAGEISHRIQTCPHRREPGAQRPRAWQWLHGVVADLGANLREASEQPVVHDQVECERDRSPEPELTSVWTRLVSKSCRSPGSSSYLRKWPSFARANRSKASSSTGTEWAPRTSPTRR